MSKFEITNPYSGLARFNAINTRLEQEEREDRERTNNQKRKHKNAKNPSK